MDKSNAFQSLVEAADFTFHTETWSSQMLLSRKLMLLTTHMGSGLPTLGETVPESVSLRKTWTLPKPLQYL